MKRIIALVLSLVMALSLCAPAWAEGSVTVKTADELATAVKEGATEIQLADGEYDVKDCGGKTLTISGSKNAVIKVMNEGEDGCDYGFGSAGTGVGNVTFNGVTIDTTSNTGNYKGFAYMKGTFNDCNFVGAYSLNNANDFEFNNCTFDFKNGYFWTWGAKSVTFNECTFNGNTKNILAHGYEATVITINDCTFAATEAGKTGAGDVTAVVEIDPAGTNTYTINFTGTNSKTEFYASWTRVKDDSTGHTFNYAYAFSANGGTGTMTGATVASGAEITLPECTFTAPSGKQFKAWSINGTEYAVGAKVTISESTEIIAVWENIPVYYPVYIPTVEDTTDETVASPDTFDAGIALYVGVSVMGAIGTVVLGKKRED